jgi:hypothetical protein
MRDTILSAAGRQGDWSGRLEDGVQVPLEEFPVRPIRASLRQCDRRPGAPVELLAVPELVAQPRADQQPEAGSTPR